VNNLVSVIDILVGIVGKDKQKVFRKIKDEEQSL
jgi:hypothetical protein